MHLSNKIYFLKIENQVKYSYFKRTSGLFFYLKEHTLEVKKKIHNIIYSPFPNFIYCIWNVIAHMWRTLAYADLLRVNSYISKVTHFKKKLSLLLFLIYIQYNISSQLFILINYLDSHQHFLIDKITKNNDMIRN